VLGGLLAGIGFEIAKRGFAIYLTRVPTYTLIYGAFATIPIFLIWLYLSWVVVLTGAVFTAVLPVFGRKSDRARVPGEELADALGVLGALARAHEHGDVLPLNALARSQRLSPDRCEEILVRAASRGWVARTDGDVWVLARDASQIQGADVYSTFVYDANAVGLPQDHLGLSLRDFAQRNENEEKHEAAPVLSPP